MRVSNNMMFNSLMSGMDNASTRLLDVHQQLSTGKKLSKPSDDPVAMTLGAQYKSTLNSLQQYERNIEFTEDYLANADSAIYSINDKLSRLKEIAIETRSETLSAENRLSSSYEVDGIYETLLAIGNTKVGDVNLFSGFKSDTQAFDAAGNYMGDANESTVLIGRGTSFTYGISGDRVFKGAGAAVPIDIYTVVNDLKVALETDDVVAIGASIDLLDSAMSQVSNITSDIGGRINRLTTSKDHIQGFIVQTKILISNLEDIDIAEVSSELVRAQTNLEALQLTSAQFTGLSIFNFLR
ncbi:MAG: flagellar hook-associated protein FlgL [Proteobacteria bacterium]|nr:flagellar hook-associated protein FlgL [Pseudomonadota bacterium]